MGRVAAAQKKLAEWQRKLKLAKTKVQKYGKSVAYYERQLEQKTAAAKK